MCDFRASDFTGLRLCGIERNFLVTLICERFKLFPFVSFHAQVLSGLNISGSIIENTC